jgi:hypothetical protein
MIKNAPIKWTYIDEEFEFMSESWNCELVDGVLYVDEPCFGTSCWKVSPGKSNYKMTVKDHARHMDFFNDVDGSYGVHLFSGNFENGKKACAVGILKSA